MNGRIAQPARRLTRCILMVGCCALSVALSGAVHAPPIREADFAAHRAESVLATPIVEEHVELAAYSPAAEARNLATELLKDVTPAPVTPAMALPPVTPTGAGRARTILMEVTAYCACPKCCGPRAQGITASGRRVTFNGGRFVAADTRLLKFNTKLLIPGYAAGQPVQVVDRGGAIKGNKLDVFFASHEDARRWGRQRLWVTVLDD